MISIGPRRFFREMIPLYLQSIFDFGLGMQPLIFSVKRYMATPGQPIWERNGTSMCYYRNGFRQSNAEQSSYWSLSFT